MIRRLEFWIRASLGGLGFGLAVLFYLLSIPFLPRAPRRAAFARVMSWFCCVPLGIRIRVIGREHIGRHDPCVYVANHQSQIDYPIVGRIYPGRALVIASQIGHWPFMGWLFRTSGCITVDKDLAPSAAAAATEAEQALVNDGASIWVFAEGTRGKTPGQMGRFKRGAFYLAAVSGRPIVPMVIEPLKPWTDLRGRRLQGRRVVLRVLEPVYARDASRESQDELRAEVRARMAAVLDELSRPPASA